MPCRISRQTRQQWKQHRSCKWEAKKVLFQWGVRNWLFFHKCEQQVCLIYGANLALGKKMQCGVAFHHSNFSQDFPAGSNLCKEMVKELKTILQKQQSLNRWRRLAHQPRHHLKWRTSCKHKKLFTDGGIIKKAMTAVAESLFREHKDSFCHS